MKFYYLSCLFLDSCCFWSTLRWIYTCEHVFSMLCVFLSVLIDEPSFLWEIMGMCQLLWSHPCFPYFPCHWRHRGEMCFLRNVTPFPLNSNNVCFRWWRHSRQSYLAALWQLLLPSTINSSTNSCKFDEILDSGFILCMNQLNYSDIHHFNLVIICIYICGYSVSKTHDKHVCLKHIYEAK